MDEKKIIKITNEIVSAIADFSIGKGKVMSLVPGSVAKKLYNDEELFEKLKNCYIEYLKTVDNHIDETAEIKRLTDFRYQLLEIYTGGDGEDLDPETESEEDVTTEDKQ